MSAITGTGVRELVTLRPGVYSVSGDDGVLMLLAWPHTARLGVVGQGVREVLGALAGEPKSREELLLFAGDCHDEAAAMLDRLRGKGWLSSTVVHEGRRMYTVVPFREPPPKPTSTADPVLSRFTVLRAGDDGVVAETPRSWCDVHLHEPAMLALIADPAHSPLPPELHDRVVADLALADVLVPKGSQDGELRTEQWSTHEMWFHERSRLGNRGYFGDGFGGTYWARGRHEPLPAKPSRYPGHVVELEKPDLPALRRTDPPLAAILEDRESVREHDDENPLTRAQLGEFLYRCARVRFVRDRDGIEYSNRPHPSGGSAYELEVYPVVRAIDGVDPGMYHYDSHDHVLRQVCDDTDPAMLRVLRVAAHSSVAWKPPQVLLVVSARVGRIMWKYESMAYALMLKHVGVLYQTMYLAATAMGLAPCALGSGDAEAFAEATGRDPWEECSVGEFMLGSRRAEPQVWELGR